MSQFWFIVERSVFMSSMVSFTTYFDPGKKASVQREAEHGTQVTSACLEGFLFERPCELGSHVKSWAA